MNYASTSMAQEKYASDDRLMKTPKKRQSWIKRWIFRSRDDDAVEALTISPHRIERGEPQIDQPERAIQFTVYNANGGRVVETRRFDRQKDRHQTGLYVITSDKEFGHEIDKIITMEALR